MPVFSRVGRATLSLAALLPVAGHALRAQGDTAAAMINRSANPVLANFRFRSIGPAGMSGRVDDIEVAPSNPSIVYIGFAMGGVFRSVNNTVTFEPVFETYGSASIGDIAIHPTNPDIVYVGTGEPNNRQSSSFGDGIYKTTDGGRTFVNIGLRETQSIARIVIDPKRPDIVYVAAVGHLFGPNTERGIYKTTDGGKTWNKIKYVDENTGFTDLVIDPSNTNILYAASYQRRRSGCCFNGGGPGSGIWKTEDAGRTWTRLAAGGLPKGMYGRIALDVARSNPNVLYAEIDVAEDGAAPDEGREGGAGGAGGGGAGGRGAVNACNNLGAPDSARVAPDGSRSGIYRSTNRGRTWTVVSNCAPRPMYYSQIRVDPHNENTVYVAGLDLAKSVDGGRTLATLDTTALGSENWGVDHHAIWIDPRNPDHIMAGHDQGFNQSYDGGRTWDYVTTMAVSLAYSVTADMGHPYYVYTGLQDNEGWAGPSMKRSVRQIESSDWFRIAGGDGMQTAVDPTDFNIVYAESQDGSISRHDLRVGRSTSIRPMPPAAGGARGAGVAAPPAAGSCVDGRIVPPGGRGGRGGAGGGGGGGRGGRGGDGRGNVLNASPGDAYRFNWNTPFILTPHNPG
ncbi:MAG TPA: hypothetical protein VG916_11790, partial [Gemmatimonadaceae bacterium]|nr:hypothetical protein [Gemmatimonadaceae bacterium]